MDSMEYERIHKVQTGIISPSKLRMKLIGHHHQRKKDGSNSNSSRTSPSKLEDTEFVKNSLLATTSGDFDEDTSSFEVSRVKSSSSVVLHAGPSNESSSQPRDFVLRESVKLQQFSKSDSSNSCSVHPVRTSEEENIDYDSNASSSSFEFHRGERSLHNPMTRSLSRPISSKWNDAEKWILSRQNVQTNYSKKTHLQSQANRSNMANMIRVAPDSASYDQKLSVKRVNFCQPTVQMGLEKFSFVPSGNQRISRQASGADVAIDRCCQSMDLKEVDNTGHPDVRSVSMRDMGTEMTPIPSQEPSRTATPASATTPLRSPISSVPSTPRRGASPPTPNGQTTDDESNQEMQNRKRELSKEELKIKTRKEIVALGVQLGKMNIAAWASKDEKEKNAFAVESVDAETLKRIEFEKRAAVWEEAEKTRHTARYKHEEINIQAWESQQKAKLEAEMKRIEAQVEQMTTHAQANVVKQIEKARQKAEEKLAAAEARRNRKDERTAAQAEYIRQTGRIPSSLFFCCG